MGSFQCLKMFVRHSPSSMICRDAFQLTPSNYASKNKNINCWKLLIASQFIHPRINGFSLASHAKIMKWCSAARERVNYFKGEGTKHSLLLHSTIGKHNNTYLGNKITVSGFNHGKLQKQNSKKPDHNETSTKVCLLSHNKPNGDSTNKTIEKELGMVDFSQNNIDRITKINEQNKDHKKGSVTLPNIPTLQVLPLQAVRNLPQNTSNSKMKIMEIFKTDPSTETRQSGQTTVTVTRKLSQSEKVNHNDNHEIVTGRCFATSKRHSSIASFQTQEEKRVQALIVEATSKTSKELANDCLQLGETFSSKPWMKQFDIAIKSSTNRIKRGRPRSSIPKLS